MIGCAQPEGVCERLFRLQFVAVLPPTTGDIEYLVVEIAERCEPWPASKGFGEHDLHNDPDPDHAQMLRQAASAAGRTALGQAWRGAKTP